MRRGEMSISIIIALVIALIVLLLILALVVPRFTLFGKGTTGTQTDIDARTCAKVGHCESGTSGTCANGISKEKPAQGWIDCSGTCCVP